MNSVYARIAVYGLTSAAAMIPLAWMNWGVTFDAASHVLTVNLDAFGAALAAAAATNFAIFKKWGVK